ncbi:MAG: tRNA 5-methoxyuridine(34)/uridine 5-oxyacetic acid(34) synthase CmoB [Oceanospirillaceae bacterium]|nr:tRNA 5-methoxyuridine(34)/uridine 5-oxyacetic acid(34) synthase CmoB [Oceanospirillaceae bacterium]MCP5335960.1 tRNA 5-methoxyuridine(34)/uridine 5-oxyacetic acid(34) synthase CmoB [Oceanospirillaceae bacterium]MCP5350905.1 tRNA 5-methoxyuridine(34)/uridine 5-oxyacetic acid(34) synthase CmoB [Oceanospirillaceae bacterium]
MPYPQHIFFQELQQFMQSEPGFAPWGELLDSQLQRVFLEKPHGDMQRWQDAFDALPEIKNASAEFCQSAVGIHSPEALTQEIHQQLNASLRGLMPWRKGPFDFCGTYIDTEWRSDWKWERVLPHLQPLKNRAILDVGCGSGYHMWRMFGEGARRVIGVDPSRLFLMQFETVKKYAGQNLPVNLLPLGIEDVPAKLKCFDTVFSMGVLYHRRSPIDHLTDLHGTLRSGGELVLETLVIDGKLGEVLMPEDRYAMMRNVWFLPSVDTLLLWLRRAGFKNARCVDLNQTSLDEQRSTDWMQFNSLREFLDPHDIHKTAEGYPAPLRAVILAEA